MKKMSRIMGMAVLLGALVSMTRADEIMVGATTQNGILEGYDGRHFQFYERETGKVLTISRTSVKQLKLDPPRKGEVLAIGKSEPRKVVVHGYAKGKFLFAEDKKPLAIMGMNVKRLSLASVSRFTGSSEPMQEAVQTIADADIQVLQARTDLTAGQQATLESYTDAKARYQTFVAESSALVSKMDTLTGADRIAALQDLRLRKEAEQPLRRELAVRQRELISAFPEAFPSVRIMSGDE